MSSPFTLAGHSLCIRIEHYPVLVKDQSFILIIRAVKPVCVFKILDIDIKHDHGPDITYAVAVRERKYGIGSVAFSFKKKQFA